MSNKVELLLYKTERLAPRDFNTSVRGKNAVPFHQRPWQISQLENITFYRGIDMLKGPVDLSILYQMFWHIKLRTIIELGAFTGASGLWMADSLNAANIEGNVFSVYLDLSLLHPQIKSLQPHNLLFIEGDCYKISPLNV